MIKNMFYTNGKHVGGSHPIFHTVPKPAVLLFKESVFDFFFPEIGIDAPIDRSRMVWADDIRIGIGIKNHISPVSD